MTKERLNEIEKYFAFLTSTFVKSISALRPIKLNSSEGGKKEEKLLEMVQLITVPIFFLMKSEKFKSYDPKTLIFINFTNNF